MKNPLTLVAFAVAASLSSTSVSAALAAPKIGTHQTEQAVFINLEQGSLGDALVVLSQQTGKTISVDARVIQNMRSPALSGKYTPSQAVNLLIRKLPLTLKHTAENGLTLVKKGTTSQTQTLAKTKVRAAISDGYLVRETAAANKMPISVMDNARSVTVISKELMAMQDVQTAEEALRYTAGVLTEANGFDLRYQSERIRGFVPTYFIDGSRKVLGGSYSDMLVDTQGLERIEVLKGPASVLYGQSSPAGIINYVSKKPTLDMENTVSVHLGNHAHRDASIDIGTSLNQDDSVLFRFNGLVRDSETEVDYQKNDRLYFAPSLLWHISPDTQLTILSDYTKDEMTPKNWFPDLSLVDQQKHRSRLQSLMVGDPDFDKYNREIISLGYQLDSQLTEQVRFKQYMKYMDFKLDYQHLYAWEWLDEDTLNRGALISDVDSQNITLDNQLHVDFSSLGIQHQGMFGLELVDSQSKENIGFSDDDYALNVLTPVYDDEYVVALELVDTDVDRFGIYFQDQITLNDWIMNVGARFDKVDITETGYGETVMQTDSHISYNLGVLYKLADNLSLYSSYATSFEPIIYDKAYNGTDKGAQLDPELGKQIEFGAKYIADNELMTTVSVFDLRKQNVVSDDIKHPGFSVQRGEEMSRGIELETTGKLTSLTNITASYTYLDTEVSKSTYPDEVGMPRTQAAKNTAAIWLDHQVASFDGLTVGLGARYVSKVFGLREEGKDYYNDAYTLFDLAARYQVNNMTFSLNASNLSDKVFTANSVSFFGQGRRIRAGVQVAF